MGLFPKTHISCNPIAVKKYDKKEVFGTSPFGCNSDFVNVFSKCSQIYYFVTLSINKISPLKGSTSDTVPVYFTITLSPTATLSNPFGLFSKANE